MQDWLEEKVIDLVEQSSGSEPYRNAVEMIENQVLGDIYMSQTLYLHLLHLLMFLNLSWTPFSGLNVLTV
jgi:hypothetical protein